MQKTIGFIGYSNKTEYVINLAKLLNIVEKKVLVVDATAEQKYKYSIPTLNASEKVYVEHFDGIDFAIGFNSVSDIKKHLENKTSIEEYYDVVILDIDNADSYASFVKEEIDKKYFFVEYSNIAMEKNKEILKEIKAHQDVGSKEKITKVIFSQYVTRASEKYFFHKIEECEVDFEEIDFVLEYSDQDRIADIEFEQSGYIDMNRHTRQFINCLANMTEDIIQDVKAIEIKKIIKLYSRGKM